MEKQGVYVIVLLIVAMFLFVVFTNPSDNKNLTGFAVGDNATDTNTTTTDTNTTVEVNVTETNTTEADNAVESCVEDWLCGSWATCEGSSQIRSCTDLNYCGTEENKPIESQSCTVEETNTETETETQTETETETETTTETATETLSQVDQILKDLEAKGLLEGSQIEGGDIEQINDGVNEGAVQTITGGVVGDGNETCEGCLIGDTCYSINKRKSDQYCAGENIWINQTALNESCTENYECDSNNCRDGTCNKFSLMKFIADWFKGLFKFEINFNMTSNNTTEIVSDI